VIVDPALIGAAEGPAHELIYARLLDAPQPALSRLSVMKQTHSRHNP
jgi:hypothetical protein